MRNPALPLDNAVQFKKKKKTTIDKNSNIGQLTRMNTTFTYFSTVRHARSSAHKFRHLANTHSLIHTIYQEHKMLIERHASLLRYSLCVVIIYKSRLLLI